MRLRFSAFLLATLFGAPTVVPTAQVAPGGLVGSLGTGPVGLAPDGPSAPGAPEALRVEHRPGRPSIDVRRPRFSWRVVDPDRGEFQTAYQVLVASRSELLTEASADVWNSGRVQSATSTSVEHGGIELQHGTRYHWRVRTWDRDGRVGPWSAHATFDVQPREDALEAEWVWDGSVGPNDTCYLRREFTVPEDLVDARLYVTAHDTYELWLDDTLLGRGPSPADPRRGIRMRGLDVTQRLEPGATVALAAVAHYHGGGSGCGVLGSPAFLCQLTFEHEDGTITHLGTDATWRVLADTPFDETAPLRGPDFAIATGVEDFDAREEPVAWREVGFDDSAWAPAVVVDPDYVLAAEIVGPETEVELLSPAWISTIEPGLYLIDFGAYASGWPVFEFPDLPAGTELTVHYSDVLEGGRIVRNRMGISDFHDRYVAAGGGEVWEPDQKYQGFRYVELEGAPSAPALSEVALRRVHTELELTGTFACSDPLLEQIWEMCARTQRNCAQGLLADCPDREQSQYTADGTVQGFNLAALAEDPGLLRKFLDDLAATQEFPGVLFEKGPTSFPHLIPEWTLRYPVALWAEHLLHDSPEILARHRQTLFDLLERFEHFADAQTGLLTNVPGNSLSDHPLDPYDESGSAQFVLNCLYVQALTMSSQVFATLGEHSLGAQKLFRANELRAAIHAEFYLGGGRYADCTGSAQSHALSSVLALLYSVVPLAERAATFDHVLASGFEPSTYGGSFLTELLWRREYVDQLLDLVLEPGQRWRRMLDEGSTTTWEAWDPLGSHCHAFTAYPAHFLPVGLLGVEPLWPGYARFRVRPRPGGDLTFAEATIPTPRGPVHARWDVYTDGLEVRVTVPVNSLAEVQLPIASGFGRALYEGDVLVWQNGQTHFQPEGLRVVQSNSTDLSLELGSGTYVLRTVDG